MRYPSLIPPPNAIQVNSPHQTLHKTTITHICQLTPSIRILHLNPTDNIPINVRPPTPSTLVSPKPTSPSNPPPTVPPRPMARPPRPAHPPPGGFTITSAPSLAYLELAIQRSPSNPVAAFLWQDPVSSLLGTPISVRVGGSFTWPPSPAVLEEPKLRKVVFVAGGVGVNPLVSMLSFLGEMERGRGFEVSFFYSMRDPGEGRREAGKMLFLERVAGAFEGGEVKGGLRLFLTSPEGDGGRGMLPWSRGELEFEKRRMTVGDVAEVIGEDKGVAVVYVCGVPQMTDEFVEGLTGEGGLGMEKERVLFEKWW